MPRFALPALLIPLALAACSGPVEDTRPGQPVKQRQDAASQFHAAGREDLASQEEKEIVIIRRFLPEAMSEADMRAHVDAVLDKSDLPRDMKSMGTLMGVLKSELEGRVDMALVSQYLRSRLQA